MSTSDDLLRRALYVTGPTASGKTAVGVALARALGAEVLALDSMTLYRGMDIGTAKPTVEERQGVPHHLIDVLDPWESASVAAYRAWAVAAVRQVEARGRLPLFVGGTPLYLKALLRGLFEGPSADREIRDALEREAERQGDAVLHARLAGIDPKAAARLHPNDRRRVIRALEVHAVTGRPLSDWQTEHDRPAIGVRVVALARPRPELHARIDRRVVRMFAEGLVEEVRALQAGPRPLAPGPVAGGRLQGGDRPAGGPGDSRRDDRAGAGPDPAIRQAAGDVVSRAGGGPGLAGRAGRAARADRRAAGPRDDFGEN